MADRVVSLHVEHVAFDVGHWCLACRYATGVRQWFMVGSAYGMHLQSRLRCYECGGSEVVLDADVAVGSWVEE